MRMKTLLLLVFAFCAVPAYAQYRAGIKGVVLDPQGAVARTVAAPLARLNQSRAGRPFRKEYLLRFRNSPSGAGRMSIQGIQSPVVIKIVQRRPIHLDAIRYISGGVLRDKIQQVLAPCSRFDSPPRSLAASCCFGEVSRVPFQDR